MRGRSFGGRDRSELSERFGVGQQRDLVRVESARIHSHLVQRTLETEARPAARANLQGVIRAARQQKEIALIELQLLLGAVDEIVASPRLLPVLLLELLWLLGHDPVRRAAGRTLSAQAIASGNPALDYIGIGGPTPLRTPA